MLLLQLAATLSFGCKSDLDCSLNGICAAGTCTCDVEWLGDTCGLLHLLPTIEDNGFRPLNASSWGGSIIRDDGDPDGRIHMFASYITEHCGLQAWKTNSEIVHLVSENPLGPFLPVEHAPRVVPRFAHNPTIKKNENGSYLLFHIGCGSSPAECPNCVRTCRNGTTFNHSSFGEDTYYKNSIYTTRSSGNVECNGPHWTGLRSASTLDGPWHDEGETGTTYFGARARRPQRLIHHVAFVALTVIHNHRCPQR